MASKHRKGIRRILFKDLMLLKIIMLFAALSAMHNHLFSQNLIANPNFTIVDSLKIFDGLYEKPLDWYYISTPDYYQEKNNQHVFWKRLGIPKNNMGYQESIDKTPYVGLFLDPVYQINNKIEMEYIYTKFPHVLKKNTTYYLEFYVSLSSKHRFPSNFIGAYFSENKIDKELKQIFKNKKNPFKAHISFTESLRFPCPWIKIAGIYKSNGNENYLYIGSFISNDSLQSPFYEQKTMTRNNLSYIYIDKVFFAELMDETIDYDNISNSKTFVLPNIFFKTNSSELLPHSHFELNKLIEYLSNNLENKIKIFGYTDNSGTNEHNQNLSEERAKTVAYYLKANGIQEERIQYFGYGSAKAVASNSTDDGREKNRRIEFQVY